MRLGDLRQMIKEELQDRLSEAGGNFGGERIILVQMDPAADAVTRKMQRDMLNRLQSDYQSYERGPGEFEFVVKNPEVAPLTQKLQRVKLVPQEGGGRSMPG